MTEPAEWRLRAACRGHADPDIWFPEEAKRICRGCVVRSECGTDAVDHEVRIGIAGGYNMGSVGDRRKLHKYLGRTPHGEHALDRCECGSEFVAQPGHTQCKPCEYGFIPVAPVLEHIEVLARTMTYREIGRRAGLSHTTIYALRRQKYVRPETARLLLAIVAEEVA
jgi:WhiB family redox-sensing transcriptional regulator